MVEGLPRFMLFVRPYAGLLWRITRNMLMRLPRGKLDLNCCNMIELFWSQIQEDANPKNSVDLQLEQENKNHTDEKNIVSFHMIVFS